MLLSEPAATDIVLSRQKRYSTTKINHHVRANINAHIICATRSPPRVFSAPKHN